jgi:exosortase/archaeosortase family protein
MALLGTSKPQNGKMLRGVFSAAVVAVLIRLAQAKDLFSDFTRPIVILALHLLGLDAESNGNTITVGHLEVPWTRDCSGLNLLLILMALAVWVNRREKADLRYWLRIATMIPAALLANVARVLSLIAYREAFYPEIESPQLHYFLGLIWVLPFVALVIPRGDRAMRQVLVESFHAAAVVALLAPMAGAPGGDTITLAAVMCLAQSRFNTDRSLYNRLGSLVWIVVGSVIVLTGMESLWLPWMLVCPFLIPSKWVFSLCGVVLTAASHPLFGMIPGAVMISWGFIALAAWEWLQSPKKKVSKEPVDYTLRAFFWRAQPFGVALCFVLPFTASTMMAGKPVIKAPPADVLTRAIPYDGYQILMANQPRNIALVWYSPHGNSRHHTLKVCMKYRGIELTPTKDCAEVFTDGKFFYREFFLHQKDLLASYPEYLQHTFRPWTSPGIHLIFSVATESVNPNEFNSTCIALATELHGMTLKEEDNDTGRVLAQNPAD